MTTPEWSFWIDVGGTFTDCVARDPDGVYHTAKVLSTDDAPIVAIRRIMGLTDDAPIGPVHVDLGTTHGTNALLERKGAAVGLVTTAGFADLLEIGTQARPDLFKLDIRKPAPLYTHVVEIGERVASDGEAIEMSDAADIEEALRGLRRAGATSLAICLINAYANPSHEHEVATIASGIGFEHVSVSTSLSSTIKALDRGDTAVLDAYLSPVIRRYVDGLRTLAPDMRLKLMTSAGGLADVDAFSGRDSLLSGPAGGVVGAAHVAGVAGFDKVIAFDMGGTSTDVSRYDGRYEYEYRGEKDGVRLVAPMYAIETVAAGGGSICRFDGTRLIVGPESAGAEPGPACYGRCGPLTVTDVNLFNGKIDARRFPFTLDTDAVMERLNAVADAIEQATGSRMDLHAIADGFTRVANLKMATAIESISTARGYDPAEHVLVAFGGAAAQHACAIAEQLGMTRVLLHPYAGILSAFGIGMADVTRFDECSVLTSLDDATLDALRPAFDQAADTLRRQVLDEGIAAADLDAPVRLLDLRYTGEETPITVPEPRAHAEATDWAAAFEAEHERLYARRLTGRDIEVVTMRVEVTGRRPKPASTAEPVTAYAADPIEFATLWFDGASRSAGVYSRPDLRPGAQIVGPALVSDPFSTIIVDPGWSATLTAHRDLLLTRATVYNASDTTDTPKAAAEVSPDPVRLELFNNRFTHIATQMGITLQRTALSVNIKERLDFSCAVLDHEGNLVVNAPHIPVHLGAMSETVRAILRHVDHIRPTDVFVTNDPDLGGSHLPDVTVVTPVFDRGGHTLRFFTASRAHHAEIGGLRPGSAFPFARCLAEEGVVLRCLQVDCSDGLFDTELVRDALTSGPYPSRAPDENISDLLAGVVANHHGRTLLNDLIAQQGWETVHAYMGHIRDAAERKTREVIAGLSDGMHTFADTLDDGAPVCVSITATGDAMTIDFSGTGPVNDNSLNANRSIVQAAVLYCLRCLIDADIPLNSGVLAPVTIVLPECMLNPPECDDPTRHPAVVGGNVELSQKLVDVIFGALGVVAASQGTMNNVVFGDERFGYYETICGGAGAGPGFDGASAVHTHMTNTRITDVEVLEHKYPVRVRRFAIRRGSGGEGRHRGGDGVVREIEFLTPVQVSLLTQRRDTAPFGLAGGSPGKPGRNAIRRADTGDVEPLGALAQVDADVGDVLTIETPGGGGYGRGT
ncbi:MAG: hydantoinase [Phycisphaera sp.]|nr:hydantoinase [Phycisphaera sp.]